MAKKRGRPKKADETKEESRRPTHSCPRCGSTNRTPYSGYPRRVRGRHVLDNGDAYALVVIRRTQCLDCGLFRFDKEYQEKL